MGKVAVDVAVFFVYVLASLPWLTGVAVHEWIGLGLVLAVFAHCVQNAGFVLRACRRGARKGAFLQTKGRVLLDAVLVFTTMAVAVSGIYESGAVLNAFGLYAEGYYFWGPVHSVSAKILLALILVHVVIDIPMAKRLIQRRVSDTD